MITSLVLAAAPAAAAPPGDRSSGPSPAGFVEKPPPGMVETIARDLRLSRAQAATRLANETRLTPIAASARGELGDRFAGAWLAGRVAQVLIVATTDPADAPVISELGAWPLVVGRSLADLRKVRAAVDVALSADSAVRVHYIDVRANKVIVLSEDTETTTAVLKAAGVDRDAVKVTASTERP
ncbi:alpha-lytic protease prodomain-containing protein, partial [Streptosporangium sp. NPDC048865]|uniref:alpha-lytic protease prodomain-containing protein n=1 Tax=Streptosporangium sp. NPDC048865 TaxID=3155766 RepID=UPI00344866D4